jgi:hypothetical protein
MFVIVGAINPLLTLCLQYLYNRYDDNNLEQDATGSSPVRAKTWWEGKVFAFADALLPLRWKSLTAAPPMDTDHFRLLANDRLVVRFSSYLAILLAFGVLFPPLAVVAVVSVYAITYFEQFAISRLLVKSKALGYTWYQEKIMKECEYIAESWFDTLKIILPFASFSYAFVVFDTLGDKYGWKVAVGPSAFVFSLPWWFYAWKEMKKRWKRHHQKRRNRESSKALFENDGDVFYSLHRTITQSIFKRSFDHSKYRLDSTASDGTGNSWWTDHTMELKSKLLPESILKSSEKDMVIATHDKDHGVLNPMTS